MKQLHGTAHADVARPIEECFAVLVAIDCYPLWCSELVRRVHVLERGDDGVPTRAETTLHVSHGPLAKDLDLLLAVRVQRPEVVQLTRVPYGPSDTEELDVIWRLEKHGETRVELDLHASLAVPRLVPLGGLGEALADRLVRSAVKTLQSGA
jgi:hypothetical protein